MVYIIQKILLILLLGLINNDMQSIFKIFSDLKNEIPKNKEGFSIANLPKKEEIKEVAIKPTNSIVEGKYDVEKWGLSTLSKTEEGYSFTAGDENFEFAVVYKTSKPNTFIIKFAAYKQPQLVELVNGNLMVDTTNNVKTYKRVN